MMDGFTFVKFTHVDTVTGVSIYKEPAKNGTAYPTGVVPTFAMTETFSTGVPTFYGICGDELLDESKGQGTVVVTETEFYKSFKVEMTNRLAVVEGDGEEFLSNKEAVLEVINSLTPDPELKNMQNVVNTVASFCLGGGKLVDVE